MSPLIGLSGASARPLNWDFPFLKDPFRNSILTPPCLIGTGKSLTFVRHRMPSFASFFPQLAFVLASELRATGRADLARELEACVVKAVSFDSEANTGSVALEPPQKLNSIERNIVGQKLGQVITFSRPRYASLQLDNFGRLIGVELVSPPPGLASALRRTSNNRWRGP